jgi:hypothetical protein
MLFSLICKLDWYLPRMMYCQLMSALMRALSVMASTPPWASIWVS